MNILFIHGNYPAQFRSLATEIAKQGTHDVRYLTARSDAHNFRIAGLKIHQYQDTKEDCHNLKSPSQNIANELICRGELIQRSVQKLLKGGFYPKLIIFHAGNGLGLFLKQLLPESRLIGYFEWYFSDRCADLILGSKDISRLNYVKARNLSVESEALACDACVTPTQWQASQFPAKLRPHLSIIFDGINTNFFKPGKAEIFQQRIDLKGESGSISVEKNDLLLTYATRGMEPLRGFTEFMEALPKLLVNLPNLKVLIGGRDRSAYGVPCPSHNGSWRLMMLEKVPFLKNHPRIYYTGLLNYEHYRLMLQRSNLHCYFTHPYVTSWSLFEAAACGTPILTNQSPATTGTIQFTNSEQVIDKISSFKSDDCINRTITLLTSSPKRENQLEWKYTLQESMKLWEDLINKVLRKS